MSDERTQDRVTDEDVEWLESEIYRVEDDMTLSTTGVESDPHKGIRGVTIAWRGKGKWAVCCGNDVLSSVDGEWDWEPSPSNRDDDFLRRFRFDSLDAAFSAAFAALGVTPTREGNDG